jgi:hypothetical protein
LTTNRAASTHKPCTRSSFTTASHKTSGLSSPAFASSIILLAISSSFAISPRSASPRGRRVISNARPMMRLVSGSNLELPKNCEMGMEMGPAIGACARRPPGGRYGGCCTAGGPGQLRLRSREPPNWYVARCSNEVQLRTGHKWPDGARCNAVSVGLRMPHPDSAEPACAFLGVWEAAGVFLCCGDPPPVAVGTPVTERPRADPYMQLSRIRLLPRVMTANVCRMRSSACDTLMRLCVRHVLCWLAFHEPN